MINFGCDIIPISTKPAMDMVDQDFEGRSDRWVYINVYVRITYNSYGLFGQNGDDNPPMIGDMLIDNVGGVFKIIQVEEITTEGGQVRKYNFSLVRVDIEQPETDTPTPTSYQNTRDLWVFAGPQQSERCVIATPSDGGIPAWWNNDVADHGPFRRATQFSIDELETGGDTDAILGDPPPPESLNTLAKLSAAINYEWDFHNAIRGVDSKSGLKGHLNTMSKLGNEIENKLNIDDFISSNLKEGPTRIIKDSDSDVDIGEIVLVDTVDRIITITLPNPTPIPPVSSKGYIGKSDAGVSDVDALIEIVMMSSYGSSANIPIEIHALPDGDDNLRIDTDNLVKLDLYIKGGGADNTDWNTLGEISAILRTHPMVDESTAPQGVGQDSVSFNIENYPVLNAVMSGGSDGVSGLQANDAVKIYAGSNWGINNMVLNGNGKPIMKETEDVNVDFSPCTTCIFCNEEYGWLIHH